MFEYIERLRKKSDKEKRQVAFLIAFLFSLTIFTFWFFAVFPGFKKQGEIEKKVIALESEPGVSFSSLFEGKFDQIKEQLDKIKNFAGNFSTDLEYYIASSTATSTESNIKPGSFSASTTGSTTIEEVNE